MKIDVLRLLISRMGVCTIYSIILPQINLSSSLWVRSDRTSHAVVVCGLEGDNVIFIDPALGKEVQLDSMTFYKAWTSRGRSGLVITRR
jgi:predicted double-glycine peptidase